MVRVVEFSVYVGHQVVSSPGKSKDPVRSIDLDAGLVRVLRALRAAQAKERLAASDCVDSDFVFTKPSGGPYHPQYLSRLLSHTTEELDLPRLSAHGLCQTCATLMLANGVPPKVAAERLGHSDPSLFLNLYSHVTPTMQRETTDKIVVRAHPSMVWTRTSQSNALRSTLREYYPNALVAFGDDPDAPASLEILSMAPTPELGHQLSRSKIAAGLRRAGRKRRIEERTTEIQDALRKEELAAPRLISNAFGASVTALVGVLIELNRQIAALEDEITTNFEQHPDSKIVRSLPGLGTILGARVLGEFGDDPDRYASAKSRKNYAGTSPITRASGTKKVVFARYARNRRIADATYLWGFCALRTSPGARALYDVHRAAGDSHHQALRAVANRMVGILHGCLVHQTFYDEEIPWGTAKAEVA